jgi:dolichol-phosphate mannosyltransferase
MTESKGLLSISLGIVCPMANEADNAVRFVQDVLAVCAPRGFKSLAMYVVVDGVSKDHTREMLDELSNKEPRLKVIWSPENRNVVDAYLRGYREALAAGCDWILEIDSGYSHRPEDIPQFIDKILEDYDCVFGSRFMRGGAMTASGFRRVIISWGGTILSNLLLGTKLTDMTSGFEMFSHAALAGVLKKGIKSQGPFFQTEIKFHCRNLKIAEVPIKYSDASHPVGGSAILDSLKHLWRLTKVRWKIV